MGTGQERNRVVLSVPNIRCGHCVKTINRELKQMSSVVSVEASMEHKQVAVEYVGDALPEVKAKLDEIGYSATECDCS
jgi:copper chaperone